MNLLTMSYKKRYGAQFCLRLLQSGSFGQKRTLSVAEANSATEKRSTCIPKQTSLIEDLSQSDVQGDIFRTLSKAVKHKLNVTISNTDTPGRPQVKRTLMVSYCQSTDHNYEKSRTVHTETFVQESDEEMNNKVTDSSGYWGRQWIRINNDVFMKLLM
ncbi:hypothetical protein ACF0H5_001929 [Mactra antiquata]